MDLTLPQFWLLLLLILKSCQGNGKNRTKGFKMVPSTCKYMLVEPQVYQRWCLGAYPLMAATRYHDKLIAVGEPFALYLPLSQDSVMVLHKKSKLLDCRNLLFKDSNTFNCLDRNANETITVMEANMYCWAFHMKLSDDLMNQCLQQNDFQHAKNTYLIEVMRTRKCILHYALGQEGAPSLRISIILPFLAVLVHFS